MVVSVSAGDAVASGSVGGAAASVAVDSPGGSVPDSLSSVAPTQPASTPTPSPTAATTPAVWQGARACPAFGSPVYTATASPDAFLSSRDPVSIVFSLNVPVPGRVRRVAGDLHPELARFDRLRERHSLLLKRFDTALDDDADSLPRLRERLRPLLSRQGGGGLDLRVTGLDYFETPPHGPGPVVYLTVESADLRALHHRLCGAFGAVTGMEGTEYVPHVTLARGGRIVDAADLADRRAIDPVEWTAGELRIHDSRYREDAARLPLG